MDDEKFGPAVIQRQPLSDAYKCVESTGRDDDRSMFFNEFASCLKGCFTCETAD